MRHSNWQKKGVCACSRCPLFEYQIKISPPLIMNMEEKPSQLEPISEVVVGETLYVPSYESFAVVRFVGTTEFGKGIWVGLELPTPSGKNSGSVKGKKYFPCQAQHGIFVRISACLRTIDTGARSNDVNPNIGNACLPPAPPEELHLSHEISPQGIKVSTHLSVHNRVFLLFLHVVCFRWPHRRC